MKTIVLKTKLATGNDVDFDGLQVKLPTGMDSLLDPSAGACSVMACLDPNYFHHLPLQKPDEMPMRFSPAPGEAGKRNLCSDEIVNDRTPRSGNRTARLTVELMNSFVSSNTSNGNLSRSHAP